MDLTRLHFVLGAAIVASWLIVCLWALVLRLRRSGDAPLFWRAVSVAQILLVLQLVLGIALFLTGRVPGRPPQEGGAYTNTFHALYGFGFPALVLFFSHKWAREGRRDPFAVFAVAGLVLMALVMRGFMVGLSGT
jgi:hypothetical protein